jgi:hypothetical protein
MSSDVPEENAARIFRVWDNLHIVIFWAMTPYNLVVVTTIQRNVFLLDASRSLKT